MKKTTDELLNTLKNTHNLDDYLSEEEENLSSCTLCEYLNQLCADKNITPAECIKRSGLDRTYAYQIFSGIKVPSRDKVLALCFGFSLTLEEIQTLLKLTGYPILYPKDERDSVIIFALLKSSSLVDTNELLYSTGYSLIQ